MQPIVMQEIAKDIARNAESVAKSGDVLATLSILRRMSLDDFGALLFLLPSKEFPAISALLPRMASEEVQKAWTGTTGIDLLRQTVSFMRQVETLYVRVKQRPLSGQAILDFGCGYGRLLRLLSYYSDPGDIWGVDAWDASLKHSRDCGVLANLRKSDVTPTSLPTEGHMFDLAFAFSVFTHLSPNTAQSALSAIRKSMNDGGVLVATTRPIKYWRYKDKVQGSSFAPVYEKMHKDNGFAYMPDPNNPTSNYGAFSAKLEWFEQEGWALEGYDSNISDGVQISVVLRAT